MISRKTTKRSVLRLNFPVLMRKISRYCGKGKKNSHQGRITNSPTSFENIPPFPPGGYIYSVGISLINTFLLLGPSNSQKKRDCHVPRIRPPFSIKMVSDTPIREDFMCAAAFPSLCR